MARKKWIDKKSASHFTLVHRPQNDPLIHDESATSMILNPTSLQHSKRVKRLGDLESELGSDVELIRHNEGEAASHGIYFDDTEYDYMQHMRDLGLGSGGAHFVVAPVSKDKGKVKESLHDALRTCSPKGGPELLLGDEILPSKNLRVVTYQAQQEIPDVLAGFRPDMDPRLREVLQALDDDAYIDEEDDMFGELAKDGEEIDEVSFEQAAWDDGDDGWESDKTARPANEYKDPTLRSSREENDNLEDRGDGDWMKNFSRFKNDQKTKHSPIVPSNSDLQSSIMTTTTNGGRRKKRKGALTNPSNYSMTSSSLFRTEGLTTLDARFEKLEEKYNADMDDNTSVSAVSTHSSTHGPVRGDFDSIMDEFLGNYSMRGKKHIKKGKYQTGLEQLDEVRKGMGPAIIKTEKVLEA